MEYVGRVPAPPLDRFIDDIYCLTGVPRHRRMNVPPMPSAHLFVNLGGPARLRDSDPSVPPAVFTDGWFMGVWTRRFLFEYPTRVRLVGVHFKPWGISPFAGMPAADLRDRWVPVDAVWQRSLDRIRTQAGDIGSAAGTLRVLEEELRSRLAGGAIARSRPGAACRRAAGGFPRRGPGRCAGRCCRGEWQSPGHAVQVSCRGHPEAGGADLPLCPADRVRRRAASGRLAGARPDGGLLR